MPLSAADLTTLLKREAAELGFTLAGVSPAINAAGFSQLAEWIERGYAGQMHYLEQRLPAYEHPRHVLEGVRSILMLALPYRAQEPVEVQSGEGRISRYAWGERDYHDVIHERLKRLIEFLRQHSPAAVARGVVDSAPLLEREFAERAGLGWVGKHTLLLNRKAGSYFFLAALLTDFELVYDEPSAANHCGSCTACLDACPTQAFPAPYLLDASRCISYLTIELREAAPLGLREGIGDWLFGCDICQEVCPWNRKAPLTEERVFSARDSQNPVDLIELLTLDDAEFRRRFRQTPLWRSKRRGLLRNAAYVLGNQKCEAAIPALIGGLNDDEPLVRGACAWALGQIGTIAAIAALEARMIIEGEATVLEELTLARARKLPT